MQSLLAGKTVVLATNQLQYTALADEVFMMRRGCVVESGPPQELLEAGGDFAALMKETQVAGGRNVNEEYSTLHSTLH